MILTEEQELMRNIAREFAQKEVAPRAKEIDATDEFPADLLKKAADLNFTGITIPEEYGGVGADLTTALLVVEEISKESPVVGILVDIPCAIIATPLLLYGTEAQKQKYLPAIAKGEMYMGFAITEPGGGSDVVNPKTFAVLDGDEWVINGSKCFITGITGSDAFLITAKTEVDEKIAISAFIIEKDAPGFEVGKIEKKTGWKGSATGEIFFKNCRIPKENLLGPLNKGLAVFNKALDEGRMGIGAIALGNAQGAFERAVAYSKEREQFGKPICKFQAIAFYLADMATDIEVARAMLYNTAALSDAHIPFSKEAAMTKLFCGEMVKRVTDKAVQIHGGNGYIQDFGIERYWRDARCLSIVEGSAEIQKMIISNSYLR